MRMSYNVYPRKSSKSNRKGTLFYFPVHPNPCMKRFPIAIVILFSTWFNNNPALRSFNRLAYVLFYLSL